MFLSELPVCPPGSPVVQLSVQSHSDWTEGHCTAPPIPWLSPRCLLSPVQEAVTALRGPRWQNGGPGMPSLSFCKSKAALCPNGWPLPHLFQTCLRNTLLLPWQPWDVAGVSVALFLYYYDRSHQYCRLACRAVKEEMGIFTLVSHSWYSGLQMENRLSTVMMLCHCLGQWISAVCSCNCLCSWVAVPSVCSRAEIMGIKPLL